MNAVNDTTLILCAGAINYAALPVSTNTSNAMIPVNGQPVIGWIIDDLLEKGIKSAVVVVRPDDHHLRTFIQRAARGRMNITVAETAGDTILHSVRAGLQATRGGGMTRVILGDTLIRAPYHHTGDVVYVGAVEESRRWCIARIDADGRITDLIDKRDVPDSPPYQALAGYYHLQHGAVFAACIDAAIADGARELSRALLLYHADHPIYARALDSNDWFDFGNIDHLVDARRRLLAPRHFNELSINPVLNTITKTSLNDAKLSDELDWYTALPAELQVLTPRIVAAERANGRLRFVQEYYGYPTLAELWVYGDLHADTWIAILRRALRIHDEFRRYTAPAQPADALAIYRDKTWDRVEALRASDPTWARLLARDTVTVNGRELRGLPRLRDDIDKAISRLIDDAPEWTILHGDFCFSNILFDLNNQIIRLIDPRGSFGRKGIYGDPRYDIAKLRHSVCGLYDFITADLFDVTDHGDDVFESAIYADVNVVQVSAAFDALIRTHGYNASQVRLIEALLFLSMPPLHADKPARQHMMLLTAFTQLNDLL